MNKWVFLFVALALVAILDRPGTAAQEGANSGERTAKIKVVRQSAGKKAEIATQIVFRPGKRAEAKVGGFKLGDETHSIEFVIDSQPIHQPPQYLIEARIKQQFADRPASTLAAPKLLTTEGQAASIQLGDENGDELKIDLLIEPTK